MKVAISSMGKDPKKYTWICTTGDITRIKLKRLTGKSKVLKWKLK